MCTSKRKMNSLCFSLLLFCLFGAALASITTIEIAESEKACCPLKWLSLDESTRPVSVQTGYGGVWFVKDDLGSFGFRAFDDDLVDMKILDNFYNCSLTWTKNVSPTLKRKTNEFYMPVANNMAFAVSSQTEYYSDRYSGILQRTHQVAEFYDIFQTNSGSILSHDLCKESDQVCQLTNRTILYVDCVESSKNIMVSELHSIELNEISVLSNSLQVEMESVRVINKRQNGVTYRFFVKKTIPVSFSFVLKDYEMPFIDYLKNDTNVDKFLKNNPHSILNKMPSGLLPLKKLLRQINSAGNCTFESEVYTKFDKIIHIPPNSTCEISALVTAYFAEEPVTVGIAIVPTTGLDGHWNSKRILSSFQASGLNTSRLVEEDGKLLLRYNGHLVMNTFTKDDIDVSCTEIEG